MEGTLEPMPEESVNKKVLGRGVKIIQNSACNEMGHRATNRGVSKKPVKITQVRLSPKLSKAIDAYRAELVLPISRNAWVEFLIWNNHDMIAFCERKGYPVVSKGRMKISDLADNSDSTFKK